MDSCYTTCNTCCILFSWLTFDNFVLPELFLYGSMSPNDDKASSLVPVLHEMVFYLKIHHTRSILFINGYSYSKCEFYRDIRRWRLSTTYLKTHVWKLIFAEGTPYSTWDATEFLTIVKNYVITPSSLTSFPFKLPWLEKIPKDKTKMLE